MLRRFCAAIWRAGLRVRCCMWMQGLVRRLLGLLNKLLAPKCQRRDRGGAQRTQRKTEQRKNGRDSWTTALSSSLSLDSLALAFSAFSALLCVSALDLGCRTLTSLLQLLLIDLH